MYTRTNLTHGTYTNDHKWSLWDLYYYWELKINKMCWFTEDKGFNDQSDLLSEVIEQNKTNHLSSGCSKLYSFSLEVLNISCLETIYMAHQSWWCHWEMWLKITNLIRWNSLILWLSEMNSINARGCLKISGYTLVYTMLPLVKFVTHVTRLQTGMGGQLSSGHQNHNELLRCIEVPQSDY